MAETVEHAEEQADRERASRPGLWFGLTGGIIAWGTHIAGMPAIQPYICESGETYWFHALSVATIVPCLAAAWAGWRYWESDESTEGVVFLGQIAVILSLISLGAILAEWAPVFFLAPCASL